MYLKLMCYVTCGKLAAYGPNVARHVIFLWPVKALTGHMTLRKIKVYAVLWYTLKLTIF